MRIFVYIIIFFSFFDLFTQLPIMSPFAKSLGATPFLTGLAVGMYSLSNTVGNIASGFWTDRKGSFRMLLIGLLSTGIVLFLYVFVHSPWSLLLIRFLHGLAAGLIVPAAFTYIANATVSKKKGQGAAISGAFVGLAAIIGPAFSGIVASRTNEATVLGITGIFMFFLGVFAFFVLKTAIFHSDKQIKQQISSRNFFKNTRAVKAFAGAFFLMFSQGVLAYMLPLKVMQLGSDTQTSGLLLSTFGVVAVLVFILPINRLFDRLKAINTFAFGLSTMGMSLIFISFNENLTLLYYIMALYGIGFAFLFPSINSLLIEATDEKNRGKAYGYFYAFFSIGVIVGSGLTGLLQLSTDGGFLFTGILIVFAAVIIRLFKETPTFTT